VPRQKTELAMVSEAGTLVKCCVLSPSSLLGAPPHRSCRSTDWAAKRPRCRWQRTSAIPASKATTSVAHTAEMTPSWTSTLRGDAVSSTPRAPAPACCTPTARSSGTTAGRQRHSLALPGNGSPPNASLVHSLSPSTWTEQDQWPWAPYLTYPEHAQMPNSPEHTSHGTSTASDDRAHRSPTPARGELAPAAAFSSSFCAIV